MWPFHQGFKFRETGLSQFYHGMGHTAIPPRPDTSRGCPTTSRSECWDASKTSIHPDKKNGIPSRYPTGCPARTWILPFHHVQTSQCTIQELVLQLYNVPFSTEDIWPPKARHAHCKIHCYRSQHHQSRNNLFFFSPCIPPNRLNDCHRRLHTFFATLISFKKMIFNGIIRSRIWTTTLILASEDI